MKITEMLTREDFYAVNEKTLAAYYRTADSAEPLYVYPRLNAIVTRRPSRAVREYLLSEYAVRGNALKRVTAQGYVQLCLASRGALAAKRLCQPHAATADTLIYPCNRKYRIFDFAEHTVDVVSKEGFPTDQLSHEIAFRSRAQLPAFVPTLLSQWEGGYRESIIDGKPLARIGEGYEALRDAAYAALREFGRPQDRTVPVSDYTAALCARLTDDSLQPLLTRLCCDAAALREVTLTFSHGDLQAGNIWVENGTQRIFIIDWESWGERSVFYDKAVLYDGLRPAGIDRYRQAGAPSAQQALVLLEDLAYRFEECRSLPDGFGTQGFAAYADGLRRRYGE